MHSNKLLQFSQVFKTVIPLITLRFQKGMYKNQINERLKAAS